VNFKNELNKKCIWGTDSMSFTIFNVKKLYRENDKFIYYCVVSYKKILEWDLNCLNARKYNGEIVQISCKSIIEHKADGGINVELEEPRLLGYFYKGNPRDEYLILIKKFDVVDIIVKELLMDENFQHLVEIKRSNISKKSLKIITLQSLEKVLERVFSDTSYEELDELVTHLKKYMGRLINENLSYFPHNIRDFLNVKQKTIIHTSNIWYLFFRNFYEQWEQGRDIIPPILDQKILFQGWTGTFFERDNPLWNEIYGDSKRLHYPSKKAQVEIYNKWKEITKFSG